MDAVFGVKKIDFSRKNIWTKLPKRVLKIFLIRDKEKNLIFSKKYYIIYIEIERK